MEYIIRAHILAAGISYCAGNLSDALTEASTGLNHAEGCGYGQFSIDLLLQLAKINLAIPDPRKALGYARKALDRSEHVDCQYARGIANGLHLCGICHKALGERELAKKRFEAALEIRLKIQHPDAEETRALLQECV
jgi:tetratricopeptide (TPR) repeat protein